MLGENSITQEIVGKRDGKGPAVNPMSKDTAIHTDKSNTSTDTPYTPTVHLSHLTHPH